MLLAKEFRVSIGEKKPPQSPPPPAIPWGPIKVGLGPRTVAGSGGSLSVGSRNEEELRMCAAAAAGDLVVRGFSHESEHDLAALVSDFLENGSSGTEKSWFSTSDSESGFSDLHHLAERISFWNRTVEQYETDLLSAVHSYLVSMKESDLQVVNEGQCNASCIRESLVKLLKSSGYDAAVCSSKWHGDTKVPGGDHEYIDVVINGNNGVSERLIIEIDFQSHFEIARAVESYEAILSSLPIVYVGSLSRLDQFLQIMVEATRWSLKQNSMPLPPWRSLTYLQAKWHSSYERRSDPDQHESNCGDCNNSSLDHDQCIKSLRRLKMSLWSEMDAEHFLNQPISGDKECDKKRKMKFERRQRPSLLSS